MKKTLLLCAAVLCMAMAFTACGGSKTDEAAPADGAAQEEMTEAQSEEVTEAAEETTMADAAAEDTTEAATVA